jgi:hypothetical protein
MSKENTTPVDEKETADVKTEDLETRSNKNKRFLPATEQVVDAKTAAEATKKAAKESK